MPSDSLLDALYGDPVPPEETARECDFIERMMPLETHPAILDLACETGRHAIELAARGYDVVGVDIDTKALEVARRRAAARGVAPRFIEHDLHDLDDLQGPFDGMILFWHSFGFFGSEAQSGIFQSLRRLLRPGGRILLDLYNRLYYSRSHKPPPSFSDATGNPSIIWRDEERIESMLGYEDDRGIGDRGWVELIDPNLFTPGEIAALAASHGLRLLLSCSAYDPNIAATSEHQRMQLVFVEE